MWVCVPSSKQTSKCVVSRASLSPTPAPRRPRPDQYGTMRNFRGSDNPVLVRTAASFNEPSFSLIFGLNQKSEPREFSGKWDDLFLMLVDGVRVSRGVEDHQSASAVIIWLMNLSPDTEMCDVCCRIDQFYLVILD